MGIISSIDLRSVDLNLLVVFNALMKEKHVTRAAATLHISQGGVSAALGRLRKLFDDELFVRSSSGMVPTPKALEVAPRIGQALSTLTTVLLETTDFDPSVTPHTFHLAMSDDVEAVLAPQLLRAVERQGLPVDFSFRQTNSWLWRETLSDPTVDVAICATPQSVPSGFHHAVLFSSSYSCIYDGPRLQLSSPISQEAFLQMNHVRIAFNGQRGVVDEILESEGLERRAIASFTHFSGALSSLITADVIVTLPTYTAEVFAETVGLTLSPFPFPTPWFSIGMLWSADRGTDSAQIWLRRFIEQAFNESTRKG